MTKAEKNLFALVPTTNLTPSSTASTSLVPLRRSGSLGHRAERIEEEYQLGARELQRTGELALFAQEQMGRVSEHAEQVFVHTSGEILLTASLTTDREHQRWVSEFTKQNLGAFGRHLLGLQEAADYNLARTVSRPLYAAPPRERTFWEKLFDLPAE